MPLVFPSLALPLLPGPRPLLPGSSLSRPPAFAYRVLLAADILSLSLSLSLFYPPFRFPSIYFTLYLRSLSGTRHTGTPGKSVAHRYLIISIGPSSVLLKTTRFAQGSRPGLRSPPLPPLPTPGHLILFRCDVSICSLSLFLSVGSTRRCVASGYSDN